MLKTCTTALLLGVFVAAAPAGAMAQEGPADITAMCGTKPMKVALTEGFATNTWRMTQAAEFADEAAKCSNITEVLHLNAGGDQQKYKSDLSALVAQGVDIILAQNDYGESAIPGFRDAMEAGVTVVPYYAALKGKPGRDFAANVVVDQTATAKKWADWFGKNLPEGNIVFLGGPAGSPISTELFTYFSKDLAAYPDLKIIESDYVVTNWQAVDAQQATAAMIAKHGKIDGIVTDYGVTALAVVNAFQQAGLKVPPIATLSTDNQLNCRFLDDRTADKKWDYFAVDGFVTDVRYALRRAVAIRQGTENNEPLATAFPISADSFAGVDPKCDPSLPPDADLNSSLSIEALKKLLTR